MINKWEDFKRMHESSLNENFDPEIYRKGVEATGRAYRKYCIDEILKMKKNESFDELDKMDTQSLSNYYNYLFWGDEGFLDRPGMEEYKEKIKNNN